MSMGHDDQSQSAPAGWYPIDGGGQRYWDGAAWTDHISPGPAAGQPSPQQPAGGPTAEPGAGFPPGVGSAQPTWAGGSGAPYGNNPVGFAGIQPAGQEMAVASTPDDRSMALLCHVLGIFTWFVGPLIVWVMKKDQSPFVDRHGKQALNFQLSLTIYWIITFFAMLILIGFLFVPVLFLVGIILPIIAAVAANKGEMYRYPLSIPFFS